MKGADIFVVIAGGDWIIQEGLQNCSYVADMLPKNAPLSTLRIVTASEGQGMRIDLLSCVWRAGRAGQSADPPLLVCARARVCVCACVCASVSTLPSVVIYSRHHGPMCMPADTYAWRQRLASWPKRIAGED